MGASLKPAIWGSGNVALPHGDKLFGGAGVNGDGSIKVGFGCAHLDRNGYPLDDFGGIVANHMGTQNFIGRLLDYQLHQGFGLHVG